MPAFYFPDRSATSSGGVVFVRGPSSNRKVPKVFCIFEGRVPVQTTHWQIRNAQKPNRFLLRIFWGDGPRVSQAKTERDVDFAWVPRQIEGDGRERERESSKLKRERNRERESENPLYCRLGTPSIHVAMATKLIKKYPN